MCDFANFWWRDDGLNLAIRLFSKIPRLPREKTLKVDDFATWEVFVGVSIRSNTVREISFQRWIGEFVLQIIFSAA